MATSKGWRWILGLTYIVAVATIWIGASLLVQSMVHLGVSPFLITYICNSLFIIYIPIFEIGQYVEDKYGSLWFWQNRKSDDSSPLQGPRELEMANLLAEVDLSVKADDPGPSTSAEEGEIIQHVGSEYESERALDDRGVMSEEADKGLDAKGRWTRTRVAKAFLGEKFTWAELISVLLCMGGTIIVSVGNSESASSRKDTALLGDISLVSASLYAVYFTLVRKKLPGDDEEQGQVSMAQFLGYLGLFNLLVFLPVAQVLHFAKLEPFTNLNRKEVGLIVGK